MFPGQLSYPGITECPEGSGTGTIIIGAVEVDADPSVVEVGVISAVSVEAGKQEIVEVNVISAVSIDTQTEKITVETCCE